jgi:prolyl 4-hydroxylase
VASVNREGVRRRGDVLLFWSVTLEGKIDPASMHAGCPVIRGTKWTGTKWLHQRPFRWTAPPKPGIPEGCEDQHINCPVRYSDEKVANRDIGTS